MPRVHSFDGGSPAFARVRRANLPKIGACSLGVALLCATLFACSRNRERIPGPVGEGSSRAAAGSSPNQGLACIAVLGSSTAAGYGLADVAASWVGRYQGRLAVARPGVVVRNLAVPGFSTFEVLPTGSAHRWFTPRVNPEHNVTAALEQHPIAIIVNLPSNDAALGFTIEQTMTNLRVVVATAREARVPTWVTTSQPRILDPDGVALLEHLRDAVQREFRERSLDFWTPLVGAKGKPLPALNQGDGVHPNIEGHRRLFEVVDAADIPGHLPR